MSKSSKLLFDSEPIVINRLSAKILGLNEAIVLQQVHYWLEINKKGKNSKNNHFHDGKWWTYNTYEEWQSGNFDFWSVKTVKRIFKKLFDLEILIKGNYNKAGYDRTTWVTINYSKLDEIVEEHEKNEKNDEVNLEASGQNDPMSNINELEPKLPKKDLKPLETDKGTNCPNAWGQVDPNNTRDYSEISKYVCMYEELAELKITTEFKNYLLENSKNIDLDLFERIVIETINNKRVIKKDAYIIGTIKKIVSKGIKSTVEYDTHLEVYKNEQKKKREEKKVSGQKSNSKKVAPVKTRFHNINQTFDKYAPDELEQLLLSVQKEKFNTPEVNAPVEKPIKELGEKKKTQFHNFEETEETFDKYTPSELDAIIEKSQAEKFGKLSQNKSTDNNEANPEVNPEVVIFNPRFKID